MYATAVLNAGAIPSTTMQNRGRLAPETGAGLALMDTLGFRPRAAAVAAAHHCSFLAEQ
jgi:hypothetical protein